MLRKTKKIIKLKAKLARLSKQSQDVYAELQRIDLPTDIRIGNPDTKYKTIMIGDIDLIALKKVVDQYGLKHHR